MTISTDLKAVDILKFNADIKEKFGFDFYPYLNDNWFNGKEQPGFLISKSCWQHEIIVGDRSRYQVSFIASNPEPVAGLFNVSFRYRSGGAWRKRGGDGGMLR